MIVLSEVATLTATMSAVPVTITTDDLVNKDIFEIIGLESASQDKKDKIMSDMLETIENRVTARMLDALEGAGELENFDKLTERDDKTAVDTLLERLGIDVAQISAEESMLYKMEMANMLTGAILAQQQPAS